MSKRHFTDSTEAEDFANDMVFGGDRPDIVAELIEVWPDAESFDHPDSWGDLYVVWGTEADIEAEAERLGEYIDRKGITERQAWLGGHES